MKNISLLILFLLFVAIKSVFAQSSETALKEYYADAEFFFAQEFYVDALSDYLQVMKRGYADNANLNYRVGVCYLNIPGQKSKSIDYLEKAKLSASPKYKESSLNEKYAPIDVYLYLGNAYRVNESLEKALENYLEYKKVLPVDEKELHRYTDIQIEACNKAREFMTNPVDVNFKNLGPVINSSSDDYRAVISGNGKSIVYMHKLPFYEAVYFATKVGKIWSKPENITPQIMSDGDQYVNSISYDGKLLFLNREDEFNSDIYMSSYANKRWSKSEPVGSDVNTKFWESHASLSKDGRTLYFTSNRKGGQGNMDIYSATRGSDGKFGQVKNLGSQINTDLNEDTPFITADNNSMYFSSQGYANMGGYDIFVSHRTKDGWTAPENLGYPINSTDDDLFYFPVDTGETAYLVKLAPDGYGGSDIYQVMFASTQILEEMAFADNIVEKKDTKTTDDTPDITGTAGKDESKVATPVETTGTTSDEEKTETPTVAAAKVMEVYPVLFDFDRVVLTVKAKTELDKVAGMMKANPDLKIELIGYTDAIGSESYNLRLSESRAVATMKYLISVGIPATNLKATGKGETNFIAKNIHDDGTDSPEGRRFNRRVEFEISGADEKNLMIKRLNPVPENLQVQRK